MTPIDELECYLMQLAKVPGHADRHEGLRDYCLGLLLPIARKSIELIAAHIDPKRRKKAGVPETITFAKKPEIAWGRTLTTRTVHRTGGDRPKTYVVALGTNRYRSSCLRKASHKHALTPRVYLKVL